MDSRSDALDGQRVRYFAAGHDQPKPGPPIEELVGRFTSAITPLGVRVERVGSVAAAVDVLLAIANELGVSEAKVSAELLETFPNLAGGLGDRGLRTSVSEGPADALDAPLGLTTARLAIAETGTAVTSEATLADRSVALLSLACVFVIPSGALVPRVDDIAGLLRSEAKQPDGAYTTLITGPSRTADIELSLTVGVQGPGKIFVVFVDQE